MMYQVLKWSRQLDKWVPLSGPTTHRDTARLQLGQARRYCAGVALVEANDMHELAHQIRQAQQATSQPDGVVLPQIDLSMVPETAGAYVLAGSVRLPVRAPNTALYDDRRWTLEDGHGGDHDKPYHFELPREASVRYRWLRLLAQINRCAAAKAVT